MRIETPKWTDLAAALAAASSDETVVAITVWQGFGEPEMPPTGEVHLAAVDDAWERSGWEVINDFFPSVSGTREVRVRDADRRGATHPRRA